MTSVLYMDHVKPCWHDSALIGGHASEHGTAQGAAFLLQHGGLPLVLLA